MSSFNPKVTYHVNGRNVEIPIEYVDLVCMKSRKELAAEYGISVSVLRSRLKKITVKISNKRILFLEEVVEIYLFLNWPPKMRKDIS